MSISGQQMHEQRASLWLRVMQYLRFVMGFKSLYYESKIETEGQGTMLLKRFNCNLGMEK